MKHAPSKYSSRNATKNQNTAIFYSEKQEQRTHELAMKIVKYATMQKVMAVNG